MKKRVISCLVLICVVVGSFSAGVLATNGIEEIKAFLNYGISIKLDGQTQTMQNANGERVYPISYEGTTYVPIRAVSNMLGIDVEWDGANNAVLLGDSGVINSSNISIKTFSYDGGNLTYDSGGKTYNSYFNSTVEVEKFSITKIEKASFDGELRLTYEIIGTVNGYDDFYLSLKCYDSGGFLLDSATVGGSVSDGERFKLSNTIFIPEKTVRVELAGK